MGLLAREACAALGQARAEGGTSDGVALRRPVTFHSRSAFTAVELIATGDRPAAF